MALDGIVLASVAQELCDKLIGGRIDKIYQPQKDELLVTVRSNGKNYKVLLCSNSSYPRVHLSELTQNSSEQPPMFCMLLRKHLSGGKITAIIQPSFERILEFHIEATNELGDKENKKLIIEIMGRHSNIILTRADNIILDSVTHVSADKSSIRHILPGKTYIYPPNQIKLNPLETSFDAFKQALLATDEKVFKSLYFSYSGLSPLISHEMCLRVAIDSDTPIAELSDQALHKLYGVFDQFMSDIKTHTYEPYLYYDGAHLPTEFYAFPLLTHKEYEQKAYTSPSLLIEQYYHEKSNRFVVSQKTSDLKKLLLTFIDRNVRKKTIQETAIQESISHEIYKIYGELITAYSYSITPGSETFTTLNYYSEPYEEISIPLDVRLSPIENAQKYFKLYNKAKRTLVAAKEQLCHIDEELSYLQSVLVSLDILETQEDINGLRSELVDMGYLKKRRQQNKKKPPKNAMPFMTFKSQTGHLIYVGKNNYQNDELTMKFARSQDLWLHIKDGPGSHVIVRLEPQEEIPDTTLVEAATLAAFYSKGKLSSNVPIDYTLKKNVKKIPHAKPGMVIYNAFKTVYVTPEESFVKTLRI
ncbi:MAG: Rqc2 family fibronectin-binding protein [Cellulosilyticaceae bacterium]